MIRQFQTKYQAHVFSPTNSSARLINGTTIYQFFNCTPFTLKEDCIKPFDYQYVIIDEVFMFNKYQMNAIIKCIKKTSNFKTLYLFGDPYQLRQIAQGDEQYFYKAFDDYNISIKTIQLKKYYRAKDQQLMDLLDKYRKTGILETQDIVKNIQQIDTSELNSYIKSGYTLICGTHKAIQHYSKYIKNTFNSLDGRMWYIGQQIYLINRYGNCQRFSQILDYKNGVFYISGEKDGEIEEIQPIIIHNEIQYSIQRGDIITVNISQGQTMKGVIIDFASFFEFGSAYTALSRTEKLNDMRIISLPIKPMQVDLQNQFI